MPVSILGLHYGYIKGYTRAETRSPCKLYRSGLLYGLVGETVAARGTRAYLSVSEIMPRDL